MAVAVEQAGGLVRGDDVTLCKGSCTVAALVDIALSPRVDGRGSTSQNNTAVRNANSRGHVGELDIVENKGSGEAGGSGG